MFIFVLACNGVIVILNCYLIWQMVKLRIALTQLADTLEKLETQLPLELKSILLNIRQQEYTVLSFRKRYGLLQEKWEAGLRLIQFLKWFLDKSDAWRSLKIDNRGAIGDNGGWSKK